MVHAFCVVSIGSPPLCLVYYTRFSGSIPHSKNSVPFFLQMEFESREVALRDALESDFQADLDGQLLLAEIQHQKEIDALRLELGGGKATLAEAAAGAIVIHNAETPRREEKGEGASGASSSARSPSLSRRPLQRKMGSSVGGNLGRKFPVFKTPVQKPLPDVGSKNSQR